jgi:hypothetical protein
MGKHTLYTERPFVIWILAAITFTLIFVYHTYPLGLSDFWWHLNTGRWMLAHGSLPVEDPFLYSSPSPLDTRGSLILRGYPLSQLLFFGVHDLGGIYALMLLKGVLMTLFYGLLWNHLRGGGLHPVLALAAVAPLPLLFFRFDELRPQIFSFIGTLLVLQLTEHIIAIERRGKTPRWYLLAALPILMLLWANLHRGFIIGIGMLAAYLVAEWICKKHDDNALSDRALRRFSIVVFISSMVAFVNPVGVTAIWASFTEVSGPFARVVDEFFGTVRYFVFHGMRQIGYMIVGVAVIPFIAILFKWRKVYLAHLILAAAFLAAGLFSFRFSLMMVAVLLLIAGKYYGGAISDGLSVGNGRLILVLWCVSAVFLAIVAFNRTSLLTSPLENRVIPSGAVDYLEHTAVKGNIYNYFEYGGYLSWRIYPRKIFIDQRNLSWDVYEEYSRAWRGDYAGVFDKYHIDAVLYRVYDMASGRPSRLVGALLGDSRWAVGYYDGRDIVFIRPDVDGALPVLPKQPVVNDIMQHLRKLK